MENGVGGPGRFGQLAGSSLLLVLERRDFLG
jgi:hypothetical protein